MTGTAISFNGNDLQTASFATQDIDHGDMPTKNANVSPLAHANRSVIPYINYPGKTITISGVIIGSSAADCNDKMDTFKGYFNTQDANLDIGYSSSTRRYIATATAVSVKQPGGLNYATFTVTFQCTLPFGLSTTTTTLLNGATGNPGYGRTLGSYTDTLTFLGSSPYQAPIITITLTAVTYIGTATTAPITIGNSSTGQSISVTRGWAAGDILTIDTSANVPTVKVNGTLIDYQGAFPIFTNGAGTLTYSDGFATRTFNETVTQVARYQ